MSDCISPACPTMKPENIKNIALNAKYTMCKLNGKFVLPTEAFCTQDIYLLACLVGDMVFVPCQPVSWY